MANGRQAGEGWTLAVTGLVWLGALSACGLPGTIDFPAATAGSALDAGVQGSTIDAGDPSGSGDGLLGTVSGQITLAGDLAGSVAVVQLNPGGRVADADALGSYVLSGVRPGNYWLSFSAPSYQTKNVALSLLPGEDAVVAVALQRSLPLVVDPGLAAWLSSGASESKDAGGMAKATGDGGPDGGADASADGGGSGAEGGDGGPTHGDGVGSDAGAGEAGFAAGLFFAGGAGGEMFLTDGRSLAGVDLDAGLVSPVELGGGAHQWAGVDALGEAMFVSGDSTEGWAVSFATPMGVIRQPLVGDLRTWQPCGERLAVGIASGPGQLDWSAVGSADVSTVALVQNVEADPPAVAYANGRLLGWSAAPGGWAPQVFGVGIDLLVPEAFSLTKSPLTTSLDGDWAATMVQQGQLGGQRVVAIGETTVSFDDQTTQQAAIAAVYPAGAKAYLGELSGAGAGLFLESSSGAPPWSTTASAWAPLHGQEILYLQMQGGGARIGLVGAAATLPFAHPWSLPAASADNRYLVFAGVPAVFDLVGAAEIPLPLIPAWVQFDDLHQLALFGSSAGALAAVSLRRLGAAGASASGGPQGRLLEGQARAAHLTADGNAVLYAGRDPGGTVGVFLQPLPAL